MYNTVIPEFIRPLNLNLTVITGNKNEHGRINSSHIAQFVIIVIVILAIE